MRMIAVLAAALLGTSALAAPMKPAQALVDDIQTVLNSRKQAKARADAAEVLIKKIEHKIGLRDEHGQPLPFNQRVEEYAKRLLGLGNETFEDFARQTQEYKMARQEVRSLSEQAIEMAKDHYKPAPAMSAGNIASGPPKPATADDVPSYLGNPAAYAPVFSERVPEGKSGSTDDAGNVLIGPKAFDSPGKLAFTLYHEGEHFERLLTPGLDLRNNPKEEVLARTRQRPLLESTFGLTVKEIADFEEVLAADRIRATTWATHMSRGLSPYKKSQQGIFVDNYKPVRLEDGVSREVDSILIRTKELREQERLETERRRQEADAEDARRAAAAWRMRQYRSAASNCGLVPKMTRDGRTYGFKDSDNINVEFTEPVTLDQAKAAMMMARACSDGERDYPQANPCTDALGAMRANWGNARFRQGLELDADAGHIDGCLRAIRENGQPPRDMGALNKRVSSYLREWKDANKRRQLERQNKQSRESEEGGRRARGDAEERSGHVPDQHYDLTPARRSLENARRSHF